MDLEAWGWDDGWSDIWAESVSDAESYDEGGASPHPDPAPLEPGRVTTQERTRWTVETARGPREARVVSERGSGGIAAVGDWVAVRPGPSLADPWSLDGVLPRRSKFSRRAAGDRTEEQVVAANVDVVWIVHGLDVIPNARRLERYLAVAWESGAQPEIVLTKADIAVDLAESRRIVGELAFGAPVHVVSLTDSSEEQASGAAAIELLSGRVSPGKTVALLGPSGVGKTLLSKALAEFMFGDEDALIHIDMSEYMEKHNVSRLIGAPPGYVGFEEGGQLTEKIRRRPYSVVLLDEIEKAHPDVFNTLLQVMEEGRLTDSFGRHVDFRNVILIMTSNIGAELIMGGGGGFGFEKRDPDSSYDGMKKTLLKEIERFFRPEFINRLDEIIVFRQLTKEDLVGIIEFELDKVRVRLKERDIQLELDQSAKEFLMDKGFNPDFGARPLRRAIEQYVEDALSEAILRGEFEGYNSVRIFKKDGEEALGFESTKLDPPTSDSADDAADTSEGDGADSPGEPEASTT